MKQQLVKIKSIQHITNDVLKIVTKKPQQYNLTTGQVIEVAINKKGPFTFAYLIRQRCKEESDTIQSGLFYQSIKQIMAKQNEK